MVNNQKLLPFFKEIEEYIEVIYYSDSSSETSSKHYAYFSFYINLQNKSKNRLYLTMIHFVHLFVDKLAAYRFSFNVPP